MERLFAAYFENGEDIGDIRVLSDIADVCGMDGSQVADMLESDQDVDLVEREDQLAREMGVTGVPAMIFGNKVAVSGAREPEMLAMAIDKALEMARNPKSMAKRLTSRDAVTRDERSGPETERSGSVGDDFVAAGLLGAVERLIGAMQQRFGVVVLAFQCGDADGDGEVERVGRRG